MKKYCIENLAFMLRNLADISAIYAEWATSSATADQSDRDKIDAAFWTLHSAIMDAATVANVLDGYDNPPETTGTETAALAFR